METHLFETTRFGSVGYTDGDVVTFQYGLIGFAEYRRYLLLAHKPGSAFRWLQSLDDPQLAFLVTDPDAWVGDYRPSVTVEDAAVIGLTENTPRILLVTVTIPAGEPDAMTLNLAGPLVINAESQRAMQLVMHDETYTAKHRVFPPGSRADVCAA